MDRVERLMTIPAVGPITALTWTLEIGEVQRFSSIKKAISPNGSLVLFKIGTTAERPTHAEKNRQEFTPALL
jgi:hypothetical protein